MTKSIIHNFFNALAPLICDAHIHVGQWMDGFYFSPEVVCKELSDLGIARWIVSSTTTSDNNFEKVKEEYQRLKEIAFQQTIPLLWVTPKMLDMSSDLNKYEELLSYGLKIHGFAEHWEPSGKPIRRIFNIAKERKIPILLHTGYLPAGPEAGKYENLIKQFPDVTVILAHGKPEDQTIYLLKTYHNVFVDTSYISTFGLRQIFDTLGDDKILFGTDFPLDKYYYPDQSSTERYKKLVNMLVNEYGEESFLKWANKNILRTYKIRGV